MSYLQFEQSQLKQLEQQIGKSHKMEYQQMTDPQSSDFTKEVSK